MPQIQANAQTGSDGVNEALKQAEGMTVGKTDPNYAATLDALRQAAGATAVVPGELGKLDEVLVQETHEAEEVVRWIQSTLGQMRQVAAAAKRLSEGLDTIQNGSKQLAQGTAKLDKEASKLTERFAPAQTGTEELVAGLGQLTGGTTELERRLGEAYSRSYPLQSGAKRIAVRVQSQSDAVQHRVDRLRNTSPGIFDSGYFVLSALDGTTGAAARTRRRRGRPRTRRPGGDAAR